MTAPRVPVRLTFRPRAILLLIALVAAGYLVLSSVQASIGVLTNLLVAAVLAALLRPFVVQLATRMRLGLAVGLVLTTGLLVAGGVLAATAVDLNRATDVIAADLRTALADAPPGSLADEIISALDIDERVVDGIESLPTRLVLGSDSPLGGLDRVSRALLLFVLGFVFITRGPAVVRGAVGLVSDPARRDVIDGAVRAAYHVGGSATRRLLGVAALNGIAAGLTAAACGLPAPIALGLWAAGWSLVPAVGMALGWAPIIVLAVALTGPWAGVLSAAALVAAVAGRTWVLRRWVTEPTVRVNRVVVAVLFLCGWNLAGILGGIIGVFLAAAFSAAVAASGSLTEVGSQLINDDPLPPRRLPPSGDPSPPAVVDTTGSAVETATTGWSSEQHSDGSPTELVVDVSARSGVLAIVMLALLMVGWYFFFEQSGVGIALLIGFVVALALNPVIDRVTRRTGNRHMSIALVVAVVVLGVAAFATFAVPVAVDQARTIPDQVPQLVDQLDDLPIIGPTLQQLDLDDRLTDVLDRLPDILSSQGTFIDSVVAAAGDGLATALWAFILVVCLLADGPLLLRGIHDAIPLGRRRNVEKFSDLGYRSFGRYWGGSVLIAVINASVITTIALAARLPMAPILGLWSGMCSLIPQVGGLLGGGVLVIIAMTEGLTTGLIVLAVYLVYQTTENNVLLPVVIGRSVQLSPLAAMTAILIGLAVGGVIGAILATPLAGVVKLAWAELRSPPSDEPEGVVDGAVT